MKRYHKVALVFICLLTSCLFSPAALLAYTNFSDPGLWSNATSGTGFSAMPNGSQLDLIIPTDVYGSAGMVSNFTLSGDFDMQVNYSLGNWSNNNNVELGLAFWSKSQNYLMASMGRDDVSGNEYGSSINYPYHSVESYINTSDTSGLLRILRTGNSITCYYWHGAWQDLGGSVTDASLGQEGFIKLWGDDYNGTSGVGSVTVTFSNFSLSSVPVPPTILLLGGGLIGLGLVGLRRRIKKG